MPRVRCQRQIESSYSLPSRKFRFWEAVKSLPGNVAVSARGRARAEAQGRGDGAGSGESAPTLGSRVSLPRVLSFEEEARFSGEASERRPWARKRGRPPGAVGPALRRLFHSGPELRAGPGRLAAIHTGKLLLRSNGRACQPPRPTGLDFRGGLGWCAGAVWGRGWQALTAK